MQQESPGTYLLWAYLFRPYPRLRGLSEMGQQKCSQPYIYALLNCLISMWYGSPLISSDNMMVMSVNSVGAVFQFVYIIVFIVHAENAKKVRMLGLLLAVLCIFAIIVTVSLQITNHSTRRMFVGFLSCATLISMFASPLFIIKLVIQTRSVDYMPFYLSLSTFLMSTSFFIYGLLNQDAFVYAPNGVGSILGSIQLVLYFYYKRASVEDSREPLLVPYA